MQMKNDQHENLRQRVLAGMGGDLLTAELDRLLSEGARVDDLAETLEGTAWRFMIVGCGSHFAITHVDDLLAAHRASFDELRKEAAHLQVLDMSLSSEEEEVAQTRVRMRVARCASAYDIGAARTKRFLLPDEAALLSEENDIRELLAEKGFSWNGGDTVHEIWTDEHQASYELAMKRNEVINWEAVVEEMEG